MAGDYDNIHHGEVPLHLTVRIRLFHCLACDVRHSEVTPLGVTSLAKGETRRAPSEMGMSNFETCLFSAYSSIHEVIVLFFLEEYKSIALFIPDNVLVQTSRSSLNI
jgi:hypothetical protein